MSMPLVNWEDLEDPLRRGGLLGGKKTALTIGVFDGVHRGHRALIAKITGKAPELLPVVVTFRKNPKISRKFTEDIISFEEKISLIEDLGAAFLVVIDFSQDFSKISGRVFLETLNRYLNPGYIALGKNFHCGYRRDTDAKTFKTLAETMGIPTEIIESVTEGGFPVSSSRIRAALREGRNDEASLLLGRELHWR